MILNRPNQESHLTLKKIFFKKKKKKKNCTKKIYNIIYLTEENYCEQNKIKL